jgi:hypothetical protein
MNIEVDVQIDIASSHDFMGMADSLQILFAIVPGANAKRLQTVDAKGLFSI